MNESELRNTLRMTLKTLGTALVQANDATIAAHSIRMAIADVDPALIVRIREKYLALESTSRPLIDEALAPIRAAIQELESDEGKLN